MLHLNGINGDTKIWGENNFHTCYELQNEWKLPFLKGGGRGKTKPEPNFWEINDPQVKRAYKYCPVYPRVLRKPIEVKGVFTHNARPFRHDDINKK